MLEWEDFFNWGFENIGNAEQFLKEGAPYIYDQKFMDTLAWIASLPERD